MMDVCTQPRLVSVNIDGLGTVNLIWRLKTTYTLSLYCIDCETRITSSTGISTYVLILAFTKNKPNIRTAIIGR